MPTHKGQHDERHYQQYLHTCPPFYPSGGGALRLTIPRPLRRSFPTINPPHLLSGVFHGTVSDPLLRWLP